MLSRWSWPKLALAMLLALLGVCRSPPHVVSGYNLSPQPNLVHSDPQLASVLPKVESSYFGWSLILRPKGIIIGAPRAQSTLPAQRNVNETGAIYRCGLREGSPCYPYVFDEFGNRNVEVNDYTYDSEKRDNQWLGGAMDGGSLDTDKLLVCAPRFIAPAPNDYLLHGICYWVNDTLADQPENVRKISPLRLKTEQIKMGPTERYYYYMLAEQGLSAHVSAHNEEFLIGAPGIHTWKGSVIRYYQRILVDDPSLSRRDTESNSKRRVSRQLDDNGTGDADTQPQVTFDRDVPNPENWDQPNDSYFGYAVGTGYFDSTNLNRLLYVATAPQANDQAGEAYLFDFSGESINKLYVFRGSQFGEYFGYSVLTDDLNGDGLTDVVISAPQYSSANEYDEGAIYVFTNQGRFNFEVQKLISPAQERGRFGSTLTKLGDINHDGYNDIAVGAPFAGNGSVFIYLGNAKGIREQHSQRLNSPASVRSQYVPHMFGHGLSRGADIDSNGFNDLAVGAPNAEGVFVYRAYPVVQIIATANSQTREIRPEQSKIQVNVCYGIATTSTQIRSQDVAMRLVVDPQVKRVSITSAQSNEVSFNVSAATTLQCRLFDCVVRFSVADIFKPIELELHYDLINKIPDSSNFCDTCAAVDPAEAKIYTEKIIFSTGCASAICIADLKVRSVDLNHNYILGSTRTLSVTYEVSNTGETAYLPQINVTSSNRMPFAKIPSSCKSNDAAAALVCDLYSGQPLAKGKKDTITIIYDVSGITGKSMILTAEVFSTGKEQTPDDNVLKDVLTLSEFTDVDVIGIPVTPHINLETTFNTAQFVNNYEIKSNGPSTVGELEVSFLIPLAYKVPGSKATISIVDLNNITMQAVYNSQLLGIDYYQNNTQIIMNAYETSTSWTRTTTSDVDGYTKVSGQSSVVKNGMSVNPHEINRLDDDLSAGVLTASMGKSAQRQRREAAAQNAATKSQYAALMHPRAYELLGQDLQDRLLINRTIVFNCNETTTSCVRAVMHVYNFKPDRPITINLKYQVNLNEVDQLLTDPWEYFVILIGVAVRKVGAATDAKELALNSKIEYNFISKHQLGHVAWWIIMLAIIAGILALILLTYALYRMGFFKRTKKEEMDKLVNEGQSGNAAGAGADAEHEPAETETLNSGGN